jgi:hypothetical protein
MKFNKLTGALFLVSALALSTQNSYAQFPNIFNKKGSTSNSSTSSSNLSSSDIATGLKDALKIGAQNASNKLSVTNGFLGNQAIKILMPPEVAKVEKALRGVGMGKIVDEAITKLNRAAEDAAKSAAPIFVNAITSMSITDAVGILKGGDNAATNYLQRVTTSALTNTFRPTINNSLNKVGAADAWNKVFSTYNKLPRVNKVNSDLAGYVTEKALYGMFYTIAQEEAKIRKDPAAQVTSILQKVFGNK